MINPDNQKLQWFMYLLAIVGMVELYFNTYSLWKKDAYTFNIIVLPVHSIEIILNFITMYWKDIYLINHPWTIAKRYLKFDFWVDIIAAFPFFLFTHNLIVFKLFRILKFKFYLDHILKLEGEVMLKVGSNKEGIIQALQKATQFIFYLFFAAHIFA